jgi:hypothetical protein
MSKTIKAVRAEILLGNIPINVYQMPDGDYKLAGRQVTDVIEEPNNSLIRELGVKSLKALPHADPSLIQVKAETGETFIPVAIEDAATYWGIMATKGNAKAIAVLVASTIEAIERRADAVFNIQRTEEERNKRFETRLNGKRVRRSLTDAIKGYIAANSDLSANAVKFMYSNATDAVNRAVFARPAKKLCEDLKVDDRDLLRDHLTVDELRHVQEVEDLAMRLIDGERFEPVAAVKEARSRLLIPVSDRVA